MIKPKYLCCIWCGGDIPKNKPYAMYCSDNCKRTARGDFITYEPEEKMQVQKELTKFNLFKQDLSEDTQYQLYRNLRAIESYLEKKLKKLRKKQL